MKVYNTLTRKKEEFNPLEDGKVKMYVCGPTVYDNIHIGNTRPMIVFDLFRRYLEYKGYEVTFVQNYTDIDDKIIERANSLGITTKELTAKCIQEVEGDMKALGIEDATYKPKATEQIDNMLSMIDSLIEKGHAYEKDGTVFFDTSSFKEYGKLSKKNIEDLEAGARISVDESKRSPMDFVLWKPKKEGEPFWVSKYSEGRPGWHLECSVMAKAYLGESIDIHCGGTDLVFPHHENEIAQSECANGKQFAKYWMHNGLINVDNKKMSKSKGNFFTLDDIVKEFSHEEVRFFIISAHYRSPINFSKESMLASRNALNRIKNGYSTLDFYIKNNEHKAGSADLSEIDNYKRKFIESMDDDFNTADAISVIFEIIKTTNVLVKENGRLELANGYLELLKELTTLMGINVIENELKDAEILELIELRNKARKEKDYQKADEIRERLKSKNILIEDTRDGVKYKRM